MQNQEPSVAVLLSTYNGEIYIKELLDSIMEQSFKNFILFIRDDGSSDQTIELIEIYTRKHKCVVQIISNENLGAKLSFGALLRFALDQGKFDYFMFADQDDVWLEGKIQTTLEKMKQVEDMNPDLPVLIHTDLKVVDQNLNHISDSFWKFQHLDPHMNSINRLLTQNIITGCTVMINKTLAEYCLPIPNDAIMHDWWLGLTASLFGKIEYCDRSTILYRQHGGNNIGAKKYDIKYWVTSAGHHVSLNKNIKQAKAISSLYHTKLSNRQKVILDAFQSLSSVPYLKRLGIFIRFRFFKIGLVRNIGLLLKLR